MERKTTSIKVEPELWKRVKVYCVEHDMDVSDFLEKIIKEKLK